MTGRLRRLAYRSAAYRWLLRPRGEIALATPSSLPWPGNPTRGRGISQGEFILGGRNHRMPERRWPALLLALARTPRPWPAEGRRSERSARPPPMPHRRPRRPPLEVAEHRPGVAYRYFTLLAYGPVSSLAHGRAVTRVPSRVRSFLDMDRR